MQKCVLCEWPLSIFRITFLTLSSTLKLIAMHSGITFSQISHTSFEFVLHLVIWEADTYLFRTVRSVPLIVSLSRQLTRICNTGSHSAQFTTPVYAHEFVLNLVILNERPCDPRLVICIKPTQNIYIKELYEEPFIYCF